MARTSTQGCQLCKPRKFAGYGDSERIPARELWRMGGTRRRVSRKDAGRDWD
jgi:hypothetical protein